MSSSSSYTAATLQHELSDAPSVLDHRTQSVVDPPAYCIRPAGVLRYNRESDLTTIVPEALTGYPVKCKYCEDEAQPSLDPSWAPERRVVEERCALRAGTPTSPRNKPDKKTDKLLFKAKAMEDHNKLVMELTKRVRKPSDLIRLPVAEASDPTSNSFRLSQAPLNGCWTVFPCSATEEQLKMKAEEETMLLPLCDHDILSFGLCHHQRGAELLQKYYSSGMTFLTVFPDGSAQVFYPSGLLALVVVVTEKNGSVCIVYDDSDAADQPMRALFQSDGRATCYHSNRNIWLSLNPSGGQCLDEVGSRVRRWSWSSLGGTATPLHPVFLSLNDTIGVRVLGKEHVFVSFLARGQQAKFSVGSCCAQHEGDAAPAGAAVLKEDLFVKVARIRICQVIQQLHQHLMTPSCARLPKTKQAAHLRVVAQQLLDVSADVTMGENLHPEEPSQLSLMYSY